MAGYSIHITIDGPDQPADSLIWTWTGRLRVTETFKKLVINCKHLIHSPTSGHITSRQHGTSMQSYQRWRDVAQISSTPWSIASMYRETYIYTCATYANIGNHTSYCDSHKSIDKLTCKQSTFCGPNQHNTKRHFWSDVMPDRKYILLVSFYATFSVKLEFCSGGPILGKEAYWITYPRPENKFAQKMSVVFAIQKLHTFIQRNICVFFLLHDKID